MLEELMKALGLSGGGTNSGATGQWAVPQKPQVPVQSGATGDIPQQPRPSLWGQLMDDKPLSEEEMPGKAESLGAVAKDIVGFTQDVGGTLLDAGSRAVDMGVGKAVDIGANIEAGYTGVPRTDVPDYDPGTRDQREYAAAMLKKQAAIKGLIDKQPNLKNILDTAADTDPADVDKLTPEQKAAAEEAARRAALALEDDNDPKTVMESAAGFLGDLWGDKAIQNALVYYTGARLMGYSGSGSGMAAGQVLMKGWDNQAEVDLVTGTATAKAKADKVADDKIDMSKTVQMFDKNTKERFDVYTSKSGNYQVPGSNVIHKAGSTGLVTYNSSNMKTHPEMGMELLESVNSTRVERSEFYNKDTDNDNLQAFNETWGDGRATRDLVNAITADLDKSNIDYGSNSRFTGGIQNLISRIMEKSAKGVYKGDYNEQMASMIGEYHEAKLTKNLMGDGDVPKFIYNKATWNEDGKIIGIPDGEDPSGVAKNVLHKDLTSQKNELLRELDKRGVDEVKARQFVTDTRVAQEMSKVFRLTVMTDPVARRHWLDRSEDSNSSAFMTWMADNSSSIEEKYLGRNSVAVSGRLSAIDFSKSYKDKYKE